MCSSVVRTTNPFFINITDTANNENMYFREGILCIHITVIIS